MAKVVVITGASAGVGRAAAIAFARRGDFVALIARDRTGLESARSEIESQGGRAMVFPADVSVHAELEAAASHVEWTAGPIDVWVNSAMTTVFGPVETLSHEELRRVTEVTYLGAANGTMVALRRMRPRDKGTIIQVGSALAYQSIPLQAPYCGAKFAIRGFTDAVRAELIHDGSRVSIGSVHMPALNTPQFDWARTHIPRQPQPVPPIYQPEVGARAIVAMADRPRREIWVGASSIQTIIGSKLAPGFVDRYVARNAYGAQHTEAPVSAGRPDNLYRPVRGLHHTRGRFSGRSRPRALTVATGTLDPAVLGGAGLVVGILLGASLLNRA